LFISCWHNASAYRRPPTVRLCWTARNGIPAGVEVNVLLVTVVGWARLLPLYWKVLSTTQHSNSSAASASFALRVCLAGPRSTWYLVVGDRNLSGANLVQIAQDKGRELRYAPA
jgi:hypothetical protein